MLRGTKCAAAPHEVFVLLVMAAVLAASCASSAKAPGGDLTAAPRPGCQDVLVLPDAAPPGDLSSGAADGRISLAECRIAPSISLPRRGPSRELAPRQAKRAPHQEAWTTPMPLADDRWPDLGFGHQGSVSIGAVAEGRLFNGAALPLLGAHHMVLKVHSGRATNFGTDELVEVIQDAAEAVAERFPGAILTVGNLSRKGGDRIPWSISHRAGRDVDIAYFLVGEDSQQVVLPTMVPLLGPDGTAQTDVGLVRFDAQKNWALLRFLLTQREVEVQYVFAADHLIDQMFALASKEGFSQQQIRDWRGFVRQPRGTLPHDDHFHVRILCSKEDLAEGCRDIFGGRERIPVINRAFAQRTEQLLALAGDDDRQDDQRVSALERLTLMKAPGAVALSYRLLDGQQPSAVVAQALSLLDRMGAQARHKPLVAFLLGTQDAAAAATAMRILRRTSPRYARKLTPLLQRDEVLVERPFFWTHEFDFLEHAVRLVGWTGDLALGRELIPFLEHPRLAVRQAALWSLRAIAANEVFPDSVVDSPPKNLAGQWQRFLKKHRDVQKNFMATLKDRGYPVSRRLTLKNARLLLRALLDEDFVSLAAQRELRRLTGGRIPLQLKDRGQLRWLWKKQVGRSRR